jgi:hypothetical protein
LVFILAWKNADPVGDDGHWSARKAIKEDDEIGG